MSKSTCSTRKRGTGKTVSHNTRPSKKRINQKLKQLARAKRKAKKLAEFKNSKT